MEPGNQEFPSILTSLKFFVCPVHIFVSNTYMILFVKVRYCQLENLNTCNKVMKMCLAGIPSLIKNVKDHPCWL